MTRKSMTRRDDYETSEIAADNVSKDLSELQKIVLFEIGESKRGLTDIEIEDICNSKYQQRGQSTWRKRRTELLQKGLIEACGTRQIGPGNRRPLTVWVIAGETTRIKQKALGYMLQYEAFRDAKIIAIRDAPVQDAPKGQQEAPSSDPTAPKLPEFLRRAKRSTSS